MTTAQPMLLSTLLAIAAAAAMSAFGCESNPRSPRTTGLDSPYTAQREIVWAVAPLRNESGTSLVDVLALSDTLIGELQQAPGITVLPVNRSLAGMRALGLASIDSPGDAARLARALGADAIVLGTVTAWNPYDPPIIGMSLGVFAIDPDINPAPTASRPAASDDPLAMRSAVTDTGAQRERQARPASIVTAVLDASNVDTRESIRQYADGRYDPRTALGWKRYTASMALYAKFACFEMSRRLLASERDRLAQFEERVEQ